MPSAGREASWASTSAVRQRMQGNRSRDTRPEARVRSALHARGLRFRKHVKPLRDLRCQADVVFTRERVAVFIDGCYWHGCPEHYTAPSTNPAFWQTKVERNMARDRRNERVLYGAGWLVIRAWEHEPVEQVASRIEAAVARRRGQPS
jgi:DNA mismatch endonuclease (patch repair protein)